MAARYKAHERFNFSTLANDIALLQVAAPARSAPALLDLSGASTKEGAGVLALGFGSTAPQDGPAGAVELPPSLFSAELPVVAAALCVRLWGPALFNPTLQLCVGRRDGTADTCQARARAPSQYCRPALASAGASPLAFSRGPPPPMCAQGDSGGPLMALGTAPGSAAPRTGAVVGITRRGSSPHRPLGGACAAPAPHLAPLLLRARNRLRCVRLSFQRSAQLRVRVRGGQELLGVHPRERLLGVDPGLGAGPPRCAAAPAAAGPAFGARTCQLSR